MEDYARISKPLTTLLRKDVTFVWTERQEKSFRLLKDRLISAPILAHPDWDKESVIETDWSKFAISAVLAQAEASGKLRPLRIGLEL